MRKNNKHLLLLLLLFIIFFSIALTESVRGDVIKVYADVTRYLSDDIILLEGNVEILYLNYTITAAKGEYNRDLNELKLRDDILVIEGENEVHSQYMWMDLSQDIILFREDVIAYYQSLTEGELAEAVEIAAAEMEIDNEQQIMRAQGNVEMLYQGYTITAERIEYDQSLDQILIEENVVVLDGDNQITSRYMWMDLSQDLIIFREDVVAYYQSLTAGAEKGEVVEIRADELELDNKEELIRPRGNVTLFYQGYTITAENIEFNQKTDEVIIKEDVLVLDGDNQITSQYMWMDLSQDLIIFREDVVALYQSLIDGDESEEPVVIKADELEIDNQQDLLKARGNLNLIYQRYTITAEQMEFDQTTDQMILEKDILVLDGDNQITSQYMWMDLSQDLIIFREDVVALYQSLADGDELEEPVAIKADELEIDNQQDLLKARGNLDLVYQGYTITADQMEFDQTTEQMILEKDVLVLEGDNRVVSQYMWMDLSQDLIIFREDVVAYYQSLTADAESEESVEIKADELELDNQQDIMIARGNVEMIYLDYNIKTAKVIFDSSKNEMTAEGDVFVLDGDNWVRSQYMWMDLERDFIRFREEVSAYYYSIDADGEGVLTEPVEITAEEMEIDNQEDTLRAVGNVEALYQDFILKADELILDQRAELLTVKGDVYVERDDGTWFIAREVVYYLDEDTFTAFQMQSEFIIRMTQ